MFRIKFLKNLIKIIPLSEILFCLKKFRQNVIFRMIYFKSKMVFDSLGIRWNGLNI